MYKSDDIESKDLLKHAQESRKSILITGATGGLGRFLAKEFASGPEAIILHGRNQAALEQLQAELEAEFPEQFFSTIAVDLLAADAVDELIQALDSKSGLELSSLILNAGYSTAAAFSELSPEEQQNLLRVNLEAQVLLAGRLWPRLERLIVISSSGAYQAGPYTALYYASKAFLNSWTMALEAEAPEKDILLVCPGAMSSDFALKAGKKKAPLAKDPAVIARQIKKSADQKKAYLAPGGFNKFAICLSKLLPNRLNARLVRRIQLDQTTRPDIRR
ncbi:MAG: SDR family NAD(P)-dependent oxidoreductase [Eubacteriales bacterium]|nr:SDR family NAD(P)-dependent oxidoreductase [Eubacteriales bacterium]